MSHCRGVLVAAALSLAGVLPDPASAQGPFGTPGVAPINRPTVSPFINLGRGNSSPVTNYYGIIRPQEQFANNINTLQQEVNTNRDLITTGRETGTTTGIPVTGHGAYFLNTSSYFLTTTGSTGGTRQPGAAPRGRGR